MVKKPNSLESTKEELDAKIQHLQQELDLERLKASSHPQQTTLPQWHVDSLTRLLTEHSSDSINQTLETLINVFALCDCSLWRKDPDSPLLRICNQWRSSDLKPLDDAWLSRLLAELPHLRPARNSHYLIFDEANLPAFLRTTQIHQTVLFPIQCDEGTDGFLTLHGFNKRDWSDTELERLASLAEMMFRVQHRQANLYALTHHDIRFQYVMEATPDGLWDWDINTDTVYFNHNYLGMLGYEEEELPDNLDTLHNYFLHPDDAERVITQYNAAIENRRTQLNMEYRLLHKNGSVLWVYSRAKFVEEDDNGMPTRCVGINANITDYIQAQEELLSAKTQADMANKTKSEFLARMSHEIRTPMNAIIGLGHLLQDTALDDQQNSYLNSMNTAAESLLHIINQVLDFSKIETGKIILENAHFDLDQIFEKLSRLFEISAVHRAVDIIYDIDSNVPRFLRGDASRLSQIISHLITNALQYSRSNQVVVGVKALKRNSKQVTLEFTITDFGVGMNDEQLEELHNILLKGKASSSNSGFGLSICNRLVSLMNGHIRINSKRGQGSKISFTASFENSHIGSKSLYDQPQSLKKLRALIVDDNTIARNIIASTAHSIHMHADTTDSVQNALKKIRAAESIGKPYHVVLMDYNMPTINGLEGTGIIKTDDTICSKPLVFLISSFHRDEIFNDNTAANIQAVDDFISKPVSESRLFDTINQAIEKDEALRALLIPDADDNNEDDALLTNLRVLLVEDNLVNQQVALGILKKKSVKVTLANNGREAVDIVHANPHSFDIILMDMEMPEMDGYEATQCIRKTYTAAEMPIIAVTAQAMRGDRERCLAAGMDDYLSKPIMPDTLYRTLADKMRALTIFKK